MTDYLIYLVIAIIIAIFITLARTIVPKDAVIERSLIGMVVGWTVLIYTIILGFSISNFYNRYIDIRENFIEEATNLQIIYRSIKELSNELPNKYNDLIEAIKNYSSNIYNSSVDYFAKKKYNEETSILYNKLDSLVIDFAKNNPNIPFSINFLNRLSTDIRIKKLIDEMNSGQYYINIISFLLIFIVIPLALFKLDNVIIQLIIDICVLVILLSVIFLLNILNVPFGKDNPISLNLNMYDELYNEIINDQINL